MMEWTYFWFGSATFFGILSLHPFTSYPLSLILLSIFAEKRTRREGKLEVRSSVAICTCAYNEVKVIGAKIENLLELKSLDPSLEILVYDDASTDGTGAIAASYGDRISLHQTPHRTGKTAGMNRLVAACNADIVVFTDANVRLEPHLLEKLATHFVDPRVGCVCGHLTYTNPNVSVTAYTGSTYWRLEQFIKVQESLFGSVMGADGSIFAIRRALHKKPPDDIIDDMYVSLQILCDGHRVIQAEDVRGYEQSVTVGREEFHRKIRIACQAHNVHRLIWPRLRSRLCPLQLYFYISHKWLRWFAIYFMGFSYGCLAAALTCANFAGVCVGMSLAFGAAIWMGGRWKIPVISSISDILGALTGAGLGVWKSFRGARFQTWEPAESIRK